jgi:hypothetical protein
MPFFTAQSTAAQAPNSRASGPAVSYSDRIASRFSIGGGISPLGIGAEISTNLNSHLNARLSGSMFDTDVSFSSNGFNADGKLRFASIRLSGDVFPFHNGFRISPGLMFYNQNRVTAADTVAPGSSFTLNNDTFYSAHANSAGATPVNGTALLNLHSTRPAFTITGGWGNTVPRRGHWSFPVEVGVALIGSPKVDVNLQGWACHDQAEKQCTNIADPNNPIAIQVQNDLKTEVNKWTQDLDALMTYQIVSVGVSYSFHLAR